MRILRYVFVLTLFSFLVGCGGGSDPNKDLKPIPKDAPKPSAAGAGAGAGGKAPAGSQSESPIK